MAANELVWEVVVVMCAYLMKECQHTLEKRKKNMTVVNSYILLSGK
jgi:hypothetical protein